MAPTETSTKRTVRKAYQIRDTDGTIIALHERIPEANGGKRFVWKQPDGTSGLGKKLRVVELPLYGSERLPQLPTASVVVVTEGEGACDALIRHGIATVGTVTGASSTPSDAVLRSLLGFRVVLWPDNDEPGRQHMARIGARLVALGADVRLVDWPDAPEHGDAADYAGDPCDLVSNARPLPVSVSRFPLGVGVATGNESPQNDLFLTAADICAMAAERLDWLVVGFLAIGVIFELDGKLKASGKTTFIGAMVRALVTGGRFLGQLVTRTPVVWLTEERTQTFQQTLRRSGLEHNHDVHVLYHHNAKLMPWPVVMRLAVDKAKAVGAKVIIVDTIGQWAGLKGDAENSNGAQMEAVGPLQDAAADGMAIGVLRHERKGGGEVGESGRGGSAFSGAVDIIASLTRGEGRTKASVRQIKTLSRFDETPMDLVIDRLDTGEYVVLGDSASVAALDAEAAFADRLPKTETAAIDLEALRTIEPVIGQSTAKVAIKKMTDEGRAHRIGSGKRGDPYRFFSPIEKVVATQTYRSNQQLETEVAHADCL